MADDPPKPELTLSELASQIESESNADIYMYAGPVAPNSERRFNEFLVEHKRKSKIPRENAILFVTTYGGSADVAYQLVRSIRRNYPNGKFSLFVDSICKSAGTLIALGADEIVMSDTAELGPLDIQLQKPGELGEMMSGLTAIQALSTLRDAAFEAFEVQFLQLRFKSGGAISTKLAAELSAKIVVGLFRPVYAQIDPMRLGDNARSVKIAEAYGERIKTANVKDETLDGLINNYPSHGFVIDRDEASKLFNCVRAPSDAERGLGKSLWSLCRDALGGDEPIISPLNLGNEDAESTSETTCEGHTEADAGKVNQSAAKSDDQPEGAGSAPQADDGGGSA